MTNERKQRLLIGAGVVCIIMILAVIASFGKGYLNKSKKVGLILSGEMDEDGWNGNHYQGVKAACDMLGVELLIKENVKEFTGECEVAIKELAGEDADMMILSSYGYPEEVNQLIKKYPDIVFYGNSAQYHEANLTSYFARIYQARYLSGIAAGMKTESGKIGYVAAMPNSEVNRGISAFTLGVKRVNPEAEVIVAWSGSWDDGERELELAEALIEEAGADVLSYHQNQPYTVEAAEKAGVYSIAYHMPVEGVSDKCLATVVCRWDMVYKAVIREFLSGKGNLKENYWIGLEDGAVELDILSPEITGEIREELNKATLEILGGKDVFSGVIYDNEGNRKCGDKELISDEILLEQFDWYAEGVKFYEE